MSNLCFLCDTPVLQIPGQDVVVDSALFSEPLPHHWDVDKWFGNCHVRCLLRSEGGPGWAELLARRELCHFACEEVRCDGGARLFVNRNGGYMRLVLEGGGTTALTHDELAQFLDVGRLDVSQERLLARSGRDEHFSQLVEMFTPGKTVPILRIVDALSISRSLSSREVLRGGVFEASPDFLEFAKEAECWLKARAEMYIPLAHRRILSKFGPSVLASLSSESIHKDRP